MRGSVILSVFPRSQQRCDEQQSEIPERPPESIRALGGADTFDLAEYREWLASIPSLLPSVCEVWLENGRFLSGPVGALVLTVLDRKKRDEGIYLICDGGRINHARMASIERHEVVVSPQRQGALRSTIVCGPTCAGLDRLGSFMLPDSVEPGDRVIWLTAGAYHIPLETRFSTGVAPVVWFNEHNEPEIIRRRETASQWWAQWCFRGRGCPTEKYGEFHGSSA
jgi:hypothetical protein